MKPVGRERDKQIAELKGLCFHEPIKDSGKIFFECKHCGAKANAFHPVTENKHYSTSWGDAKELWDELPLDKKYDVYEGWNKEVIHEISLMGSGGYTQGRDFPDAVSQAWLKWREGK